VYWGSPRVGDYFNTERFLCLTSEEEIDTVVSEIERLLKDDAAWLTKVQQPVFTGGKLWRTVEDIARDCRNLLAQHRFKPVDQTFYLCNQEFEPERYSRLVELSTQLGLPADSYSFHCPTFKHTITDELYLKHVSPPHSYLYPELQGPERKMRRAELSLTLNYLSLFEEIDKRWLDGLFLTLESDVRPTGEIGWSPQLFQTLFEKRDQWEGVHIGGLPEDVWKTEFPETLSSASDLIRFVRHLNTRCSDSLVWTKRGIERFLAFMKSDPLYIEPFDGYLCQYLSNYQDKFRYFWSHPTFFMQRSYYDGEASTIQNHNY
jgi:hypothetical protein